MPMISRTCGLSVIAVLPTPVKHRISWLWWPAGHAWNGGVIDAVAHHLGLDPLVVRRRNFYPPKTAPVHGVTPYGQIVTDCIIQPIVDKLVADSDYNARREALRPLT